MEDPHLLQDSIIQQQTPIPSSQFEPIKQKTQSLDLAYKLTSYNNSIVPKSTNIKKQLAQIKQEINKKQLIIEDQKIYNKNNNQGQNHNLGKTIQSRPIAPKSKNINQNQLQLSLSTSQADQNELNNFNLKNENLYSYQTTSNSRLMLNVELTKNLQARQARTDNSTFFNEQSDQNVLPFDVYTQIVQQTEQLILNQDQGALECAADRTPKSSQVKTPIKVQTPKYRDCNLQTSHQGRINDSREMRETFHDEGNQIYQEYLKNLNSDQLYDNRNRNPALQPHFKTKSFSKDTHRGRKFSQITHDLQNLSPIIIHPTHNQSIQRTVSHHNINQITLSFPHTSDQNIQDKRVGQLNLNNYSYTNSVLGNTSVLQIIKETQKGSIGKLNLGMKKNLKIVQQEKARQKNMLKIQKIYEQMKRNISSLVEETQNGDNQLPESFLANSKNSDYIEIQNQESVNQRQPDDKEFQNQRIAKHLKRNQINQRFKSHNDSKLKQDPRVFLPDINSKTARFNEIETLETDQIDQNTSGDQLVQNKSFIVNVQKQDAEQKLLNLLLHSKISHSVERQKAYKFVKPIVLPIDPNEDSSYYSQFQYSQVQSPYIPNSLSPLKSHQKLTPFKGFSMHSSKKQKSPKNFSNNIFEQDYSNFPNLKEKLQNQQFHNQKHHGNYSFKMQQNKQSSLVDIGSQLIQPSYKANFTMKIPLKNQHIPIRNNKLVKYHKQMSQMTNYQTSLYDQI